MSNNKELNNLFDKLDFTQTMTIKKDFEKNYFIVRGKIKKRDVLLKVVSKKDTNRIKKIEKEKFVDKIIEKHNNNLNKPLIVKSKVLSVGGDNKYFWIIRRYYPGKSLASMRPDKEMYGYDKLRRTFLTKRDKILFLVLDNLSSLQSLTKNLRGLGFKKNYFNEYYRSDIENFDVDQLEKYFGFGLKDHINFYQNIKDEYMSKENEVACINDLSPANIIVKDDGNIVFSDFEFFSFDNFTMDIAYLWLFLWKYSSWQKRLIKIAITNEKSRKFFRVSIIRILFSIYWFPATTAGKKEKIDIAEYFKKHIWSQYLKTAGESFETLMRVK